MIQQKEMKLAILRVIRKRKERGASFEDILDFLERLVWHYGKSSVLAPFLVQVLNREIREAICMQRV
ncbi:hypothetical protein [Paenibacillus apiarius]|uniref:Uncharacterized protein n=1 Tax=Paenibacillus apiarius TaxID=46240 RepID=A0ABT4E108_9BACL|nr:hypothetical protein [Paenibacillus apiarius]MCY9517003.1 hypothetical protein [Paenibacillus apiarius]MCY9523289.1 hypothetical protein [Paenibacillus apiarius]MCY9554213.1 hypothetical protein [Paenibacillus apiarius]MCY9560824.1 hypothetical protein [Paenibacillus apiarius]MCY9682746.1 hypothetical protein [Paenibacillus apiarius]